MKPLTMNQLTILAGGLASFEAAVFALVVSGDVEKAKELIRAQPDERKVFKRPKDMLSRRHWAEWFGSTCRVCDKLLADYLEQPETNQESPGGRLLRGIGRCYGSQPAPALRFTEPNPAERTEERIDTWEPA